MYTEYTNYGKEAYMKLQDLKKEIKANNILQKEKYSSQSSYYKIIAKEQKITKSISVTANKNIGYVKIYVDNVTNVDNIPIKILNNEMIVYSDNLHNDTFDFVYFDTNHISIVIDNPQSLLICLTIEFCGINTPLGHNIGVEIIDDKIYCAYYGFDETIVCTANTFDELINCNYSLIRILPIRYFDFKKITDSSFSTGTTILALGKNTMGELVYYSSIDNFGQENIMLAGVDDAKISPESNKLVVYYLLNSQLNMLSLDTENNIQTKVCDFAKNINLESVCTANVCNNTYLPYNILVVKNRYNEHIVVVCESGEKDVFSTMLLKDCDLTHLSINSENKINLAIVKESDLENYYLLYNQENRQIKLQQRTRFYPCDSYKMTDIGSMKKYKNRIVMVDKIFD